MQSQNINSEIRCRKCLAVKPEDQFWWMWKSKGLRRTTCKTCSRASRKVVPVSAKVCTVCETYKDQSHYKPNCNQCVECRLKYVRDRRKRLVGGLVPESRQCSKCGIMKLSKQFRPSKESVGGIRKKCRDCEGLPLKKKVSLENGTK
jgi:hypothetical protein